MALANSKAGSSRAVSEETSPKHEVAPGPAAMGDGPTETAPDPGDIEEGRDAYRPGGFHPVYIGDVYADRYKIMNKIGYGAYSTVWLVKDLTKL
jgi:serine/threonine-protein kinase SRPK3